MNQANKVKLGAFILSAVVLMITCFIAFGLSKLFEPKLQCISVFGSTVEGLTVGSPVKFMGVPVGKVTRIAMRDTDGYVNVYFIIRRSSMDNIENNTIFPRADDEDFKTAFDEKRISCFINVAGIMGGAYLELTATSDAPFSLPDLEVIPPPNMLYFKSRTLHVTNIISNASRMVDQLTRVDFVDLTEKVNMAMDSANRIFSGKELEESLIRLRHISQDLGQCSAILKGSLTRERVETAFNTIDSVNITLSTIAKSLPPEKIDKLITEFNDLLAETNNFIKTTGERRDDLAKEVNDLGKRLIRTTIRMEKFIHKLSELVDSFQEQPNQILHGSKSREYFPDSSPGNIK